MSLDLDCSIDSSVLVLSEDVTCSNLEKVYVYVKATTFAITDRFHKVAIGLAKDIGRWINEAFAVAVFLARFC